MQIPIYRIGLRKGFRWMVDLRKFGGKRKCFSDEARAIAYAGNKSKELVDWGERALRITDSERVEFLQLKSEVDKLGTSLGEVVRFWRAHNVGLNAKSVLEAVREVLDAKERAGCRPEYLRNLRSALWAFYRDLGRDRDCQEVRREAIEHWLHSKGWGEWAQRNRLGNVRMFFEFCLRRGYVLKNACDGIEGIRLEEVTPKILCVQECELLLSRARSLDPGLLAFLAVQMFGGLRPKEALRISWEDIRNGYIDIKGAKAKTRERRLVTVNGTLGAWLRVARKAGAELPVRNWARRWWRLRYERGNSERGTGEWKAVVKWSHDCLRHTAASFLLPKIGAERAALELGHSEAMLFRHYRELVAPGEVRKFWGLRPK